MRIESVMAHAFGPFVNETLELAQGMTIIHGPNESGKSTWHAALYAGLCGMRRGPGLKREDKDFGDRHRPWGGGSWDVSAVVKLEDGRHVELYHDLDGKVDCQASDVQLGRNYSSEIIYEGAPDGARLLGLNRKSFLSTACVRQADIQSVMVEADALQEELQRAAATAGSDSTAAAALSQLNAYHGSNIGLDRANSRRPLRSAKDGLARAQLRLENARSAHASYLRQQEEAEQLRDVLVDAESSVQLVEAARAIEQADQMERNLGHADEMAAKYPEEPPAQAENREAAEAVSIGLDRWSQRPDAVELQGPSADDLHGELIRLPLMPDGDTASHPDVVNAKNLLMVVRSSQERHQQDKPPEPAAIETAGLDATELRALSAELSLDEPAIDAQAQERMIRARQRVTDLGQGPLQDPPQKARHIPLLLMPMAFLVRVILGIVRALLGAARRGADQTARIKALEELREAEAELGDSRFRIEDVRRRRSEAKNTALRRGLPTEASALTELARHTERAQQSRQELDRWETHETQLRQEFDQAEDSLCGALESRGVVNASPASAALKRYEEECSTRQRVARKASRKPDLERIHQARKGEEAVAAESEQRRHQAVELMREAAKAIGVTGNAEDEIAAKLRVWLTDNEQSANAREVARQEWNELQALLNGGTLQDLVKAATELRRLADQRASGLEPEEMSRVVFEEDLDAQLNRLRDDVSNARSALAEKRGSLEEYGRNMASVPEAEEELARADVELVRVIALDRTLTKTQKLLEHAQEKVHRTVAPLLGDSIRPWLQAVTGGRYKEIRIDVESLMVRVSGDGKNWRLVPLLSHGTAEQIYLLLRVAMARQLTRKGEICPLILDDVTVNCDPVRETEILNLLHAISEEQQVILFSQEPETQRWAQQQLSESRDRLIELPLSGIPA